MLLQRINHRLVFRALLVNIHIIGGLQGNLLQALKLLHQVLRERHHARVFRQVSDLVVERPILFREFEGAAVSLREASKAIQRAQCRIVRALRRRCRAGRFKQ
jgi:hypothetical protein